MNKKNQSNEVFAFQQHYEKLNKKQKEAVNTIEGAVIVIAGPGSGKTEIISMRAANILLKTDVFPSNILCLTFTDSASANMRRRLLEIIGQDAYRVAIHTFHSFGSEIINRYPEFFYNGASFSLADELCKIEVLSNIFDEIGYDNPLKKQHSERGYIYLKNTQKAIGLLKRAGLSPKEFFCILNCNKEFFAKTDGIIKNAFAERLNKKNLHKIEKLIFDLCNFDKTLNNKEILPSGFKLYSYVICDSIKRALSNSKETGKTAPLSSWKSKWIRKNEQGEFVLKDFVNLDKMYALCDIYNKYQEKMRKEGYYDFDDMILDVIQAVEQNEVLRYELQEKYLYILVDEFQDTNNAQLRLLHLLTHSQTNDKNPNIMAVGDDDQAIFKFQGAESSNIIDFRDKHKSSKLVVLNDNYRSTQNILNAARRVIKKGENRFENIKKIDKNLFAVGDNCFKNGNIINRIFRTRFDEHLWIAEEIDRLLKKGFSANTIAIIARRHKDLEDVAHYLAEKNIPIKYERRKNVLDEPHIKQLIQISRFIVSLSNKSSEECDEILPEILGYPFWKIENIKIWELSIKAAKEKKKWLECMFSSDDDFIRRLADFFVELSNKANYEPLEYVLSDIIGNSRCEIGDYDDDSTCVESKKKKSVFTSPFKEYYFSQNRFQKDLSGYMKFLSSIKTFVQALREYKSGKFAKLKDLVVFSDICRENNIMLKDNAIFADSINAISLLSVHKAKGLEFETVFILSCQDDIWTGARGQNILPFPKNLPIAPAGENIDDQLRLFYVALTRAKKNIYLTSYEIDDAEKESQRLRFLADITEIEEKGRQNNKRANIQNIFIKNESNKYISRNKADNLLRAALKTRNNLSFTYNEKSFVAAILEKYKMSVTHLNNFLDVAKNGPKTFFEQNLLRFPQPKLSSGSYGSAMHKAAQMMYIELKKYNTIPSIENVLSYFEHELSKQRLNKTEFRNYLKRGINSLKIFYEKRKDFLDKRDLIEFDFANQGVVIGNVPISGKIDRIAKKNNNEIVVYDFKTGKALNNWHGGSPYEKIKILNYKRQIIFYKLLVENSRDFGGKYFVKKGVLEFLEPKNGEIIDLTLDIEKKEVDHLIVLIRSVYNKIINLDFPNVDSYSKDINGILKFENDICK